MLIAVCYPGGEGRCMLQPGLNQSLKSIGVWPLYGISKVAKYFARDDTSSPHRASLYVIGCELHLLSDF